MNELPIMTTDQMAELTALLRNLARAMCHPPSAPGLLRDAADLNRAADLIESMAQRVPLSEEQIFDIWQVSTVLDNARLSGAGTASA